jgi:hypothetical protein
VIWCRCARIRNDPRWTRVLKYLARRALGADGGELVQSRDLLGECVRIFVTQVVWPLDPARILNRKVRIGSGCRRRWRRAGRAVGASSWRLASSLALAPR